MKTYESVKKSCEEKIAKLQSEIELAEHTFRNLAEIGIDSVDFFYGFSGYAADASVKIECKDIQECLERAEKLDRYLVPIMRIKGTFLSFVPDGTEKCRELESDKHTETVLHAGVWVCEVDAFENVLKCYVRVNGQVISIAFEAKNREIYYTNNKRNTGTSRHPIWENNYQLHDATGHFASYDKYYGGAHSELKPRYVLY